MPIWRRRLVLGMVLAVGAIVYAARLCVPIRGHRRGPAASQLQLASFSSADVALGSTRFRLLGGVSVENVTLYRLDDPTRTPILHIPSGIIYHDKEAWLMVG